MTQTKTLGEGVSYTNIGSPGACPAGLTSEAVRSESGASQGCSPSAGVAARR